MNKVILIGRLTKDPETRISAGDNPLTIARYSLAVDRKFKREGEADADFINCVALGKNGEFTEKYFRKGMKVAVVGRLQTGSYTNKDGQKVYTTDVVIEEHEFCEKKGDTQIENKPSITTDADGFMNIPDNLEEELPFN